MSFKDKHALETLPERMAALQADISKHQAMLADADLFAKKPDQFSAAVKGLETAQTDLATAEEQWLELEMQREEIEGG
jgi:ATP-binding cassette subfamily F protein uup